jgi:ABC-type transport system involved in cytochrome c biogenesis permease subunit
LLSIEVRAFWIVVGLYAICLLLHIAHVLAHPLYYPKGQETKRTLFFGQAAVALLFLTVIVQSCLLAFRSYERNACPIETRYEAYQLFALVASLSYLFVRRRWAHIYMPGVLVNALALLALLAAVASNALTPNPEPLPPMMRSAWYVWHLGASFFAYGVLAVSFAIELSYLGARVLSGLRFFEQENRVLVEDPVMHKDAQKLALFAFPILTSAILAGAAWANNAWGQPWSWEYMATASPLAWLLFAIYLHAMRLRRWRGVVASVFNILAFLSVGLVFAGHKFLTDVLGLSGL